MAIKGSGSSLSFSEIEAEFGSNGSRSLGAYRLTQNVGSLSNLPLDSGVPTSGTKKFSDFYIDTSELTPLLLRKQISGYFNINSRTKINVRILSFGFKYGIPREADYVFDMRFIANPFYVKSLKKC